MSLILVIPDPWAQEPQALRESIDMLLRLQARLYTLERIDGCDVTALRQQIAEVEEAIERTRRACSAVPLPPEPTTGTPDVRDWEGVSFGEPHITAPA